MSQNPRMPATRWCPFVIREINHPTELQQSSCHNKSLMDTLADMPRGTWKFHMAPPLDENVVNNC